MKILVVSLLRLGDIIQQEPLLRGLREKHPGAEIHLLMNKQFSSIERVLAGVVDHFVCFDRESLQQGLGEAAYNMLWSYSQLEALIARLNDEKYDKVYNFTHNKLSAYLIGALDAGEKIGLHQEEGKFCGLENRWLRYFNDRFSGTQKSLFHYVELLGHSFDIPVPRKVIGEKRKSKLILFQCLTSDIKKNWGLESFRQLKTTLEEALVDYEVRVLGASFEREQLIAVFGEEALLICDLVEVQEHLRKAAVLVTGDTSIKHIAAQLGTPVVEISLGSSDATKTAAFAENSEILQSTVACAPCSHSQACNQKSHLCAEEISVDQVFAAIWNRLSGEKLKKQTQVRDFERAVWALYLNKEHKDVEPFYLAAAQSFAAESTKVNEVMAEVARKGQQLLFWLERAERALPTRESLLTKRTLQSGDLAELVLVGQEILRSKQDECGYFQSFMESLVTRFSHPVQFHDRVDAALKEAREIFDIRTNLIRHIDSLSMEGGYYATGIGKLSISGFEEVGTSLHRTDGKSVVQRRSRETETLG